MDWLRAKPQFTPDGPRVFLAFEDEWGASAAHVLSLRETFELMAEIIGAVQYLDAESADDEMWRMK